MNEQQERLLRSMKSALELQPSTIALLPDQVNGIGTMLGLTSAETLNLIEGLKQAEFVELHWPGKVSVTREGLSALNQASSSGDQITLGAGAVYVKNSQIGDGAAIGAMATSATRIEQVRRPAELEQVLADLVAVREYLLREQAALPINAQEPAKQLADEANGIQQEMRKPNVDKVSLEQRLDKAKGFLEKIGGVAAAASSLKPALGFLHRSFDWLSNYVRTIAG